MNYTFGLAAHRIKSFGWAFADLLELHFLKFGGIYKKLRLAGFFLSITVHCLAESFETKWFL